MSNDLQWLLLRGNNSFIVKRVTEGPIFSKEPGNLLNLHSYKYSGLANSKTIDISDSPSGIRLTTRSTKKPSSVVGKSRTTSTIRANSSSRRAHGAAIQPAKSGYRPDLRRAALARVSAILASKKAPKPTPERKLRGKKAKSASA